MQYYTFSSLFGILQCKLEVLTKIKGNWIWACSTYTYLPVHYRNKNSYVYERDHFPLIETRIEEAIYLVTIQIMIQKELQTSLVPIASQPLTPKIAK